MFIVFHALTCRFTFGYKITIQFPSQILIVIIISIKKTHLSRNHYYHLYLGVISTFLVWHNRCSFLIADEDVNGNGGKIITILHYWANKHIH